MKITSAIALPLLLVGCATVCFGQAPVPDSPAIEQQANAMLQKLSLQQKVELIGGVNNMFIRAEPAAGFPELKMSDGPVGMRSWGPDTAYAAGMALAAAWDPELDRRVGVAIAQDARARGVHFVLGPGVDIYRAPMCGRNFEYFGEDPFLSGRTAIAYINGVQSQGVIATVKHYDANNEEYDRHNVSSDMDERTLREIYTPAFEAAVKDGHVGAVMNSYNLVNGVHSTQNKHLNIDILKNPDVAKNGWAFNGILMSDWVATYNGVDAANAGLDLEMPSARAMTPADMTKSIQNGRVSEATIDDKVRRIFRTAIRFGFLDRNQTIDTIPEDNPFGRSVALDEARESLTLLKNDGNLLPLDPARVHTIAVIGPDAWPAVTGGGGSSNVTPYRAVSFREGITAAFGPRGKVLYARGLPTADEMFTSTNFNSLKVETFDNTSFSGTPSAAQAEHIATWKPRDNSPLEHHHKSMRYTAVYTPQKTGSYLLLVGGSGRDTYKVMVDGKQVLEETRHEGQAPQWAQVPLTAGRPANIQIDYLPDAVMPRLGFGIRAMDDLISADAKKMAAQADAVVVAVGFDPSTESEGYDRTFSLPWGQNELIEAIAKANRKTVVTITAGGNVDMQPWLASVPAVFHNWYPGEEGGTAFAEVLFGRRSPEGHITASFERSWSENPVHDNYYAPPVPAGQVPRVKYAEGVFLGYRYYTTYNKQPLFPFGFGLSYTTFGFSNLQVSPQEASADGPITVSFDVTNTGHREGADVAQLYVGDPSAKVKRPVKELKGYEKVRLAPGQKQHVSLTLDRRSLAYWDMQTNGWGVDPGKFMVYVGDSSEQTPLTASFEVR